MAVVVAAAAATAVVENKLEGRGLPKRDYGDKRERRETAETADWQR